MKEDALDSHSKDVLKKQLSSNLNRLSFDKIKTLLFLHEFLNSRQSHFILNGESVSKRNKENIVRKEIFDYILNIIHFRFPFKI